MPAETSWSGIPRSPPPGDYRILYLIEDASSTVTIVKIGHRREVYRN